MVTGEGRNDVADDSCSRCGPLPIVDLSAVALAGVAGRPVGVARGRVDGSRVVYVLFVSSTLWTGVALAAVRTVAALVLTVVALNVPVVAAVLMVRCV